MEYNKRIFDCILDEYGECEVGDIHKMFCRYAEYANTKQNTLKVLYYILKFKKIPKQEHNNYIDNLIKTSTETPRHYSDIDELKRMCVSHAKLNLYNARWNMFTDFNQIIDYIDYYYSVA